MNKLGYIICLFVLILGSCKSTKTSTGAKIKKMNSEKIIANHYKTSFDFETLSAKLKIRYDDGKRSVSPAVSLRMAKDETIWVSVKMLGITLAKALITPDKVSYYEKINSTYFEGDFELLSNWLGTELDFEKVQQLLLGQSLFDLKDDTYIASVAEQGYQLTPKKQYELFERLFVFDQNSFKIKKQELKQPKENRDLQIRYGTYQKVGEQDFPKQIFIDAQQDEDRTKIEVEYKSVDYNTKVSFPFSIPAGNTQVTIK